MKTVIFQGGLGNQLFEYTFMEYIREHVDANVRYYVRRTKNDHNGFELAKWFDCNMKPAPWYTRLYIKTRDLMMYNLHLNNPYCTQLKYPYSESSIYDGYWIDRKFYKQGYITFRNLPLNKKNAEVIRLMENTESVSIHVRRGDYLKPENVKLFGNICTKEYYNKAIEIIRKKVVDPHFFIFSDDIAWVKENLQLGNTTFVDWNTGKDSFYDMYLMSQCKHNIIANSTFSFWGARLSCNQPIVIYPEKWYNPPLTVPDIFPIEWIAI